MHKTRLASAVSHLLSRLKQQEPDYLKVRTGITMIYYESKNTPTFSYCLILFIRAKVSELSLTEKAT